MQFGVAEALDHWARYRPATIAVYAGGHEYSYAALNSLAAATAARLETHAPSQQRIGIAFSSKLRLLAALMGVLRAGRSAILINPSQQIDFIKVNLQDADAKALLHDESHAQLAPLVTCAMEVPSDFGGPPSSSWPPLTRRGPSDEWGVLFSSGTTGIPKGIVRDHESMVTELIGWCLELGLTRHTRFYVGRPIYYTGGLVLTLATLLVGGAAILNDFSGESFDAVWADYQATLETLSVDVAFFIPDQLRVFLRAASGNQSKSAQTLLTMGGPITGAEKLEVVATMGCNLLESWGNSESLGTITDPEDVNGRPDSIGRPFLTDEMFVVDEECRPVRPGVPGRLAGGEEAGFRLYCNRPNETAQTKRPPLILSEDIGHMDEEGFFYVRGRLQDSVVLEDGSTVFLPELERELSKLPLVRDCCILAASADGGKPTFLVTVVAAPTQDHADLSESIRAALPARIKAASVRVVDALPRVGSGKVDRLTIQRGFERTK